MTILKVFFQARHNGKPPGRKNQKKKSYKWMAVKKRIGVSTEFEARGNFPLCTTCKRTNHLSKDCCNKGKS